MATQCFIITDEYGSFVQNARVNVIVGNSLLFTNFTNPSGQINATIDIANDNLIYVSFNSYTPVQYVYNGPGSGTCIKIKIKTCQPLQQELLDEGRFLRWLPVMYCIRDQTEPLSICSELYPIDNPLCDRWNTEETTDYYPLPVIHNDLIAWVMEADEVLYNGEQLEDLRIGISKDGVLIQGDLGTITQFGTQLFCEATLPCVTDCEYEFVIYRIDVIDYIGVIVTPPSTVGACDGSVQAVVQLGTPPYEYSLDGITWQLSDTFTGLCAQDYILYARDQDCSQGLKGVFLKTIDCSLFHGKTLQQVVDTGITLGQVISSGCILCDFLPVGDVQKLVYTTNKWVLSLGAIEANSVLIFNGSGQADQKFITTPGIAMSIEVDISDNSGSVDYSFELFDTASFYTQSTDTTSGHRQFNIPASGHNGNLTLRITSRGTYIFKASNVKVFNSISC